MVEVAPGKFLRNVNFDGNVFPRQLVTRRLRYSTSADNSVPILSFGPFFDKKSLIFFCLQHSSFMPLTYFSSIKTVLYISTKSSLVVPIGDFWGLFMLRPELTDRTVTLTHTQTHTHTVRTIYHRYIYIRSLIPCFPWYILEHGPKPRRGTGKLGDVNRTYVCCNTHTCPPGPTQQRRAPSAENVEIIPKNGTCPVVIDYRTMEATPVRVMGLSSLLWLLMIAVTFIRGRLHLLHTRCRNPPLFSSENGKITEEINSTEIAIYLYTYYFVNTLYFFDKIGKIVMLPLSRSVREICSCNGVSKCCFSEK